MSKSQDFSVLVQFGGRALEVGVGKSEAKGDLLSHAAALTNSARALVRGLQSSNLGDADAGDLPDAMGSALVGIEALLSLAGELVIAGRGS